MPPDIAEKISADFNQEDVSRVQAIYARFAKHRHADTDRVFRCLLFLSQGNFSELQAWTNSDWRDVIVAAEYDDGRKQVRNFIHPFGETPAQSSDSRSNKVKPWWRFW